MDSQIEHMNIPSTQRLSENIALRLVGVALSLGAMGTLAACSGPNGGHDTGSIGVSSQSPSGTEQFSLPSPDASLPAPNQALIGNTDEVLSGLGRLENSSSAQLFGGAMQFFTMPTSLKEIGSSSDSWNPASVALESKAGVKSLVVFEPASGQNVHELAGSKYNIVTEAYYKYLAASGITDAQLGNVVLMPELIEGGWTGADPNDFAAIINHQAALFHQTFPNGSATTMIDLQPKESGALLGQLQNIQKNALASIGVQAFPNGNKISFTQDAKGKLIADVSSYMDPAIITSISKHAGNLPVWINTGIPESDGAIKYTTQQRVAIAHAISNVMITVKGQGVKVQFLNLFAQDKRKTEGSNFDFTPESAKVVLPLLAKECKSLNVELYGFAATPS